MIQALLVLLTASISLLIAIPAFATPVGESAGEIWVDGPADKQPGSDPNNPDAVIDHSGRSIFVWSAFSSATRHDVFLRRFDAGGGLSDDPVLVNTLIEDDQFFPRVAVSSDNSFLVIWQSDEPDPIVNVDRKWVRSQAFDAAGESDGDEQLISVHSSGEASDVNADVAALRDGGYVVVWRSRDSAGITNLNILARRIGANGVPLAAQFVANSTIGQSEREPTVTELSDGGFLVAWANPEIQGRRFLADGTPVGSDFQINTFTTGGEAEPDAVLGDDGEVLVVWKDEEEVGEDREIRARLYSDKLVPQGNDFRINTLITGVQDNPKAGDYGRGGFFVVWESATSVGDDNSAQSIQGRIVTGGNQFAGPQFQVNGWTVGAQQFPGIGGRNDQIAVGWKSQGNPDTTKNVINGQFWSICGIFCDSFEGE
jgi:hypothetical protein